MQIKIGSKAKSFELPDENEQKVSLKKFLGQYVVLYFYPKDNTPGCTTEACAIRDDYSVFNKMKIKVIGVSGDTSTSHIKFKEKFDLPFTLLSDKDGSVLEKYNASEQGGKRKTYIIDPAGIVVKKYNKVSPATHSKELIEDIKKLKEEKGE